MAMNLQGIKSSVLIAPSTFSAAGTAISNTVDCKGFEELQLVLTKTTHSNDYIRVSSFNPQRLGVERFRAVVFCVVC